VKADIIDMTTDNVTRHVLSVKMIMLGILAKSRQKVSCAVRSASRHITEATVNLVFQRLHMALSSELCGLFSITPSSP